MPSPPVRTTVGLLIVAIASLIDPEEATAQARIDPSPRSEERQWTGEIVQKAEYYRDMAVMQARFEAEARAEERRLRAEAEREEAERKKDPDRVRFGQGLAKEDADWAAKEADRRARLKARYERLASHPWETAPPDLPLPYPWDRDRDRAVLEAALRHLTDPRNFDEDDPGEPEVAAAP